MFKKVFLIFLITFSFLIIIEIASGAYLFGKKIDCIYLKCNYKYSINIDFIEDKTKKINYSKDEFGFRGARKDYQNIDFLVLGGSTTEEKFIDDNDTWTEKLEKKFVKNGNDIEIVNAGIDGQSTLGHIYNFEKWFPYIENLNPKFIIFYIGINEYRSDKFNIYDYKKKNNLFSKIKFYLKKNNGIFLNLYRKINLNKTKSDYIDIVNHNPNLKKSYFLKKIQKKKDIEEKFKKWVDQKFLNRLNLLTNFTKEIGAIPIFISQKSIRWYQKNGEIYEIENTNILEDENVESYYLKEKKIDQVIQDFTKKNNMYFISGFNEFSFEEIFFYDFVHTNTKGSEYISEIVYPHLKKIYFENF